jgi:hypothetical protein
MSESYDMIDRFLRNNLDDTDYAEYSAALDGIATHAGAAAEPVPVAGFSDESFWEMWRATNKDVNTGDILKNDIVFFGRVVARAALTSAPAEPASVWLIEDQDHFPRHRWLRIVDAGKTAYLDWETDANLAARFARRDDAVAFQKLHIDFCALTFVSSHSFIDLAPAETPPATGAIDAREQEIIARFLERTGQYVTNDASREAAIAEAVQKATDTRGEDSTGAMVSAYFGTPASAAVDRIFGASREQECWACNGSKTVATSSNGSGLIDAPCEACASPEEAPAAAGAAQAVARDAAIELVSFYRKAVVEAMSGGAEEIASMHTEQRRLVDALAATPAPEVTEVMVTAYLTANDAYWKRTDELPATNPGKWRNGTPREATRESLQAALKAAQPIEREDGK